MTTKPTKKRPKKYLQFSGMAIQIGVTIYLGNKLGEWLDVTYNTDSINDVYTKACTLIAVFIAMYSVIKQVTKLSKEND